MDTLTLRTLWSTVVDAPLAPALELLTGAGLALLGLSVVLGVAAWGRFLLIPVGPPGARPAGEGASRLAWRAGRLGLAAMGLALGGQAVVLAFVPGADVAAVLWCALGAVVLVRARGAWALWAAVLPLAPVPRLPVAYDVHRIAEAVVRWDRESTGEVTTLLPGPRRAGPGGVGRSGPPLTHRTPHV
jgi:hypothetical protein